MVMSQDQNAGRSHNIKIDNIAFEGVEQFRNLGTTLMHQSSIQDYIKCSLNSGNVCYHSVQNVYCCDPCNGCFVVWSGMISATLII